MTHKCSMCSEIKNDVAYSIDYGGPICNDCDRKLWEDFKVVTHVPVLTWGGLR